VKKLLLPLITQYCAKNVYAGKSLAIGSSQVHLFTCSQVHAAAPDFAVNLLLSGGTLPFFIYLLGSCG
jgi:hypothetical protein